MEILSEKNPGSITRIGLSTIETRQRRHILSRVGLIHKIAQNWINNNENFEK